MYLAMKAGAAGAAGTGVPCSATRHKNAFLTSRKRKKLKNQRRANINQSNSTRRPKVVLISELSSTDDVHDSRTDSVLRWNYLCLLFTFDAV